MFAPKPPMKSPLDAVSYPGMMGEGMGHFDKDPLLRQLLERHMAGQALPRPPMPTQPIPQGPAPTTGFPGMPRPDMPSGPFPGKPQRSPGIPRAPRPDMPSSPFPRRTRPPGEEDSGGLPPAPRMRGY